MTAHSFRLSSLHRMSGLFVLAMIALLLPSLVAWPGGPQVAMAATPSLSGNLDVCGRVTTGTGSISGTVTDAKTGDPIENAVARAYDVFYQQIGSVYSNADGTYTISGIPGGTYVVAFSISGYNDQVFDGQESPATFTAVEVTDGAETANINAALTANTGSGTDPGTELNSVSGTVTAADTGLPLQYVFVTLFTTSGTSMGSDTTDGTGVYSITNVPSGSYSNPRLVVNLPISCMALERVLAKARVYNSIRTAICGAV